MEVDTGPALSLILKRRSRSCGQTGEECFGHSSDLCSYSGETIPVLGMIDTKVRYKGQRACLTLFAVRGTGPSLVRRNWSEYHKIHWSDVNCVNKGVLHEILQTFDYVFTDGLGTCQGPKVTISIEPGAQPRFQKPDQFLMHSTRRWTWS